MWWLVRLEMGAVTLKSGNVHYKHPKEHEDNTLFRDLEELEHLRQYKTIPLFAIKYLAIALYTPYDKHPYEIRAKARAEVLTKQKPSDMTDDEYLSLCCSRYDMKLEN